MKRILVIGSSGNQGGEVLKELLKRNEYKIRALMRKETEFAQNLKTKGVEIVIGDLNYENSLEKAMEDVYGVFSVLTPNFTEDPYTEIKQEKNIIKAAEKQKVEILIHASVARAGDEENFVDWKQEHRTPIYHLYWKNKRGSIEVIKNSKIPHWVIFKPSMMMDNFLKGRNYLTPDIKDGIIENNVKIETKIDYTSAYDQAQFVADAFKNITKYDKKEIDLACESLTYTEIGNILEKVFNKKVKHIYTPAEELVERKKFYLPIIDSFEWDNIEGYKVDLEKVKSYGIKQTSFEEFCKLNKDKIDI